jgi:hypothetical protein
MIKLNATITLTSASGQTLSEIESNLSGNNISCAIDEIRGVKRNVKNPFILGKSVIDGENTLSSGENYFIGSQLSGSDNSFASPYIITLLGSNITDFVIVFDDKNNVYPTTITVGIEDYSNNDASFAVGNLTSVISGVPVTISNLNEANKQLIITGIYIGLTIEINDKNLVSLSRKIIDRADNKFPSWGIVSNIGNIEFNDFNENVKEYAEMMLLKQGLGVTINIQDTMSGKSQQVGEYTTNTWNYDNDSRKVTVSLQDELVEWQDILTDDYLLQSQMTMAQIYEYLYGLTPAKYNMLPYSDLDTQTKSILANTICKYPYLKGGSLWNEWQKLCEICALHIYKDDSGVTTCTYDFRS